MSQQFLVTLTINYQWAKDLLKASAIIEGVVEPRTNFKKIKYLYPDTGAGGNIYGTRDINNDGYDFVLRMTEEEIDKISQREFYSEFTTNMALKSSNDGDKLIIVLED